VLSLLRSFIYVVSYNTNAVTPPNIDYCELNIDRLNLTSQIEMSIGCSTIDGKRVYNDAKLRNIYEKKS